jgi:hypothetical protein
LAQIRGFHRLRMGFERLPGWALVERHEGRIMGIHRRQFSHGNRVIFLSGCHPDGFRAPPDYPCWIFGLQKRDVCGYRQY